MGLPNYHHHPDNWIYVRTVDGVYQDTPENFALDYGSAAPVLPPAFNERYYEPGVMHELRDNGDGTVSDVPRNVPQGLVFPKADAIIAAFDAIMTAQAIRTDPGPPPPDTFTPLAGAIDSLVADPGTSQLVKDAFSKLKTHLGEPA